MWGDLLKVLLVEFLRKKLARRRPDPDSLESVIMEALAADDYHGGAAKILASAEAERTVAGLLKLMDENVPEEVLLAALAAME